MTTSIAENAVVLQVFSTQLAETVEQAGQAVVAVNTRQRRASSGVHWRAGIVVTADHLVDGDEEITVTLSDRRTLPATLVGRDAGTDLAVLQFSTEVGRSSMAIADPATLKIGHLVLAIARSSDSSLSASFGVISALGGSWRSWQGGRIDQYIRPALMLYPGFSGGLLVTATGQIVGINTIGSRQSALTIPASTVNRVVDRLVQGGRMTRGYLGLGMQSVQLPESLWRSLNLSQAGGVIVVSLETGAPADQAGILLGDILVTLDGNSINDVRDVHALLEPEQVGKSLTGQIVRGGKLTDCEIVVGEHPAREG